MLALNRFLRSLSRMKRDAVHCRETIREHAPPFNKQVFPAEVLFVGLQHAVDGIEALASVQAPANRTSDRRLEQPSSYRREIRRIQHPTIFTTHTAPQGVRQDSTGFVHRFCRLRSATPAPVRQKKARFRALFLLPEQDVFVPVALLNEALLHLASQYAQPPPENLYCPQPAPLSCSRIAGFSSVLVSCVISSPFAS